MKSFTYKITASNGIHARPAGMLIKEISRFSSEITVDSCRGKSASAKKLFALMQLGIKQGEEIVVEAEGVDEDEAIALVSDFMAKNF